MHIRHAHKAELQRCDDRMQHKIVEEWWQCSNRFGLQEKFACVLVMKNQIDIVVGAGGRYFSVIVPPPLVKNTRWKHCKYEFGRDGGKKETGKKWKHTAISFQNWHLHQLTTWRIWSKNAPFHQSMSKATSQYDGCKHIEEGVSSGVLSTNWRNQVYRWTCSQTRAPRWDRFFDIQVANWIIQSQAQTNHSRWGIKKWTNACGLPSKHSSSEEPIWDTNEFATCAAGWPATNVGCLVEVHVYFQDLATRMNLLHL